MDKIHEDITRRGSRTFFLASLIFPKDVRRDVFILYSFVRMVDDLADSPNPDIKQFLAFKRETFKRIDKEVKSENVLIEAFSELVRRKSIQKETVREFFRTQEDEIRGKRYISGRELERFIYGTAETIGLMMAMVLNLDEKSYIYARMLGGTMQRINILRDIKEDWRAGKIYFSKKTLTGWGFYPPSEEKAMKNKDSFKKFINNETEKALSILKRAEQGFGYIKLRERLAVKTAAGAYLWTARKIKKDPFFVFRKKIKPSLFDIIIIFLKILIGYEKK